jgi:hypothetical protein
VIAVSADSFGGASRKRVVGASGAFGLIAFICCRDARTKSVFVGRVGSATRVATGRSW